MCRLGIRNKCADYGERMETSLVGSSISEGISETKGEYEWKLITMENQTQALQDTSVSYFFANQSSLGAQGLGMAWGKVWKVLKSCRIKELCGNL